MEQRLGTPLALAAVAETVNLSTSRFAHLFRRDVGTSPARYLHALRMLRARLLLERTVLSVKEVMALVGCNDPSHFSRDFRRFHGIGPRACRLGADRARSAEEPRTPNAETTLTVDRIAALANERRHPPRKPHPRARAPGGMSGTAPEPNTHTSTPSAKEQSHDTGLIAVRHDVRHRSLRRSPIERPDPRRRPQWH
jgi:AraC-like DNA-binding protein